MLKKTIVDDVSVGIASVGNVDALNLSLSSILNGNALPSRISLFLNGDIPSFKNFYLEQMASLARFHDVDFSINVGKASGVREARDVLMSQCQTKYLWMADDDVLFDPNFLEEMIYWIVKYFELSPDVAWLAGSKGDLNNRRGYDNFNVKVNDVPLDGLPDGSSYNHFYARRDDKNDKKFRLPKTHTIDTGCVLFNMPLVFDSCVFNYFGTSTNSGGEDTVFAMQCLKEGWHGRFNPNAVSYHLEKENARFNEFAARGEMVLRAADLMKLDTETLTKLKGEFMPWLFNKED